MTRVAVIGTAGRDAAIMRRATPTAFADMVERVMEALTAFGLDPAKVTLVSGGAAVADHVAAALFIAKRVHGLELHLPCAWDPEKHAFVDTGDRDSMKNPGGRANQLHRDFAAVSGVPSLKQLDGLLLPSISNTATPSESGAGPVAKQEKVGSVASESPVTASFTYEVHEGFHSRNRAIAESADYLIALGFEPVMTAGTRMTWDLCSGTRTYIVCGSSS